MTVEEVKLQLAKQKEQRFEFNLANDINKQVDDGNKFMDEYNDYQKLAVLRAGFAENAGKRAVDLATKAISQAKELGVDPKFFEGRLQMAKDLLSRSQKAKINIL